MSKTKAKSIYSRVKSTQFKPTVLPIMNHGDQGAEGTYLPYKLTIL